MNRSSLKSRVGKAAWAMKQPAVPVRNRKKRLPWYEQETAEEPSGEESLRSETVCNCRYRSRKKSVSLYEQDPEEPGEKAA